MEQVFGSFCSSTHNHMDFCLPRSPWTWYRRALVDVQLVCIDRIGTILVPQRTQCISRLPILFISAKLTREKFVNYSVYALLLESEPNCPLKIDSILIKEVSFVEVNEDEDSLDLWH